MSFTTDGVPPTTPVGGRRAAAGLTLNGALLSGTPTTNGSFPFTVTATDAAGCTGTASYTFRSIRPPTCIAVGPGAGVPGVVRHFEPNGTQVNAAEYAPFTLSWLGGVRVARADINGDDVADTDRGAGPGGSPLDPASTTAPARRSSAACSRSSRPTPAA